MYTPLLRTSESPYIYAGYVDNCRNLWWFYRPQSAKLEVIPNYLFYRLVCASFVRMFGRALLQTTFKHIFSRL